MKKRVLASSMTLVLAFSLMPGIALANEGAQSDASVTIEIGSDGAPVDTSGDGWTYSGGKLTLDAGHAFTFVGAAYAGRADSSGVIVDGTFSGTVFNLESGTIAGGTFDGYVSNYGGVISGGTFNKGSGQSENNSVDNKAGGTIDGGEFNINVNNNGTIKGEGTFNAYVQNGYVQFGADENKACTISGGTFSTTIDNFGTIEGGLFKGEILSRGIIAGGTFSSTSSVTNNDEGIVAGGGAISGGTFDGAVTNGDPDPDWNAAVITGGTFTGTLTSYGTIAGGTFDGNVRNFGAIEGGFFARAVVNAGGTMSACSFPVDTMLTGLSITQARGAELVAAYEKDSEEHNHFALVADKGYTLPETIDLRVGAADGPELVVGTDYAYDASTGAIAIKKGAVTGPLFLAASGVAEVAPVPPTPENPKPSNPATPTPLPTTTDTAKSLATSNAPALAATGDTVLPQIVLGSVVLSGGILAACSTVRRKRLRR